ncbi:MAG: endonuclease III [Candidatus Pacearchaeota archaeon]
MSPKKAIKQLKELEKEGKTMRLAAEAWKNDYETLVSTILSARSLDEITIKYSTILFEKYPTPEALSKASVSEVEKIIFPINFYQNKSKYIINCARKLVEVYKGKVPHDFEKLIELPGVGRKTANVFLSQTGKDAIGVDTHVSYISQKLGWTKNENPDRIEEDLKKTFPEKYWSKVNPTLVRFGKTHTSRRKKDEILKEIKKVK